MGTKSIRPQLRRCLICLIDRYSNSIKIAPGNGGPFNFRILAHSDRQMLIFQKNHKAALKMYGVLSQQKLAENSEI